MNKPQKTLITSLDHLKRLSSDTVLECFILLNGSLKSSKTIEYNTDEGLFYIWNLIDDTEQIIDDIELFDKQITNIGYALRNNALYYEENKQ